MSAKIIDGKILAAQVKVSVAAVSKELKVKGIIPCLQVFLVGESPASIVYVKGKEKDCNECGIKSIVTRLPEATTQQELLHMVNEANFSPEIHGILVQLPLPAQIDENAVIEAICPEKDVDGFTAINTGRLQIGEDCFVPCTPAACVYMAKQSGITLAGKDVVIVGRSNIVGKPLAMIMLQENATVTVCHSKTQNLAQKCLAADVLVAAVGKPKMITAEMLKPGAAVIDVGINRGEDGKLCGDVDFAAASKTSGAVTPVPGGVGPMTRAMLLVNTIKAAGGNVVL